VTSQTAPHWASPAQTLANLPPWALPVLAVVALLLAIWGALSLRRRWRQGRRDLEQARLASRAFQTGRADSLGPITPDPDVGQDL